VRRFIDRKNLKTNEFSVKAFEIQDAGSQLIACKSYKGSFRLTLVRVQEVNLALMALMKNT
jgi:hypothetical protein